MTNQLITYRLPIDYSLIALMLPISYVWYQTKLTIPAPCPRMSLGLPPR